MPFAAGAVVTNIGHAIEADRMRTSPGTYTTAPKFGAIGTGATGAARTAGVTDTALSTEVESRTSGTESTATTTLTNDTYRVVAAVTATGTRAVDEGGLFDAASVGNMAVSVTHAVINLSSGDTLQNTYNWKKS